MKNKIDTFVNSEVGKLEAVILHTPGKEVENMNPHNVQKALYSDILNLSVAQSEYAELKEVLQKVSRVFEVKNLLIDAISNSKVKERLINKICKNEQKGELYEEMLKMDQQELATALLEGIPSKKNTLTEFMNKDLYSLRPLHNFFFTRDASISIRDKVLIGDMMSTVRERESLIMETIFDFSSQLKSTTINPENYPQKHPDVIIEGGDILVARDDILLIGIGGRTNTLGVDFILEKMKENRSNYHIVVQELPKEPESFIHLDMVFTLLDVDKCMVYEPLILKPNRYQTIHIDVEDGKVAKIEEVRNIPTILAKLGMELQPIMCGGRKGQRIQEREQWHSGANFFAFAPGQVLGYARNVHTLEEMNKHGFDIIDARDFIKGKTEIKDNQKCVVAISGSELSRGGGGCRCMTMPVKRKLI